MTRDPRTEPTWREEIVLRAASNVTFLASDDIQRANIENGVYRALRINGLLRRTAFGHEITPEGKAVLLDMDRTRTRHIRMQRLAVLLLFLAMTCPALAEPNYRVLPPVAYDYPFKGNLITVKKQSKEEVNKLCNTPMAMGLGCMKFVSPEHCVIVVVSDEIAEAAGYTPEVVVRHEVGHCNGWPKDHPGTRVWTPKK